MKPQTKIIELVLIMILLIMVSYTSIILIEQQKRLLGNSVDVAGFNRYLTSNVLHEIDKSIAMTLPVLEVTKAKQSLEENILLLNKGGIFREDVEIGVLDPKFQKKLESIHEKFLSFQMIVDEFVESDESIRKQMMPNLDSKGNELVVASDTLVYLLAKEIEEITNLLITIQISLLLINIVANIFLIYLVIHILTVSSKKENQIKLELERQQIKLANLKEIEKQKSEFSTMISHELKTPVVPIKGYCEMLEESGLIGDLNPKQQDAVKKIYESAEILENLISRILMVQRLGLGKMEWHIDNFKVNKFTNYIIEEYSSLMKGKQIEFVNTTKDEIDLQSDENKIREVFSNLIRNSVDFVPETGGKIEIGAQSQGEDVEFYVKDNGKGISKSEQKNLFKMFYQVDTSVRRKHGGTGLGLTICKGIVDGLRGKIWLESDLNKGATFYFTIPKQFKSKK